jgi:hypothetical protein
VTDRQRSTLHRVHKELLDSSAITNDVARVRGYRTISKPAELRKLGFNTSQADRVPGLLIPIHDVLGIRRGHQFRPDEPRLNPESGRPIKYENVPGAGVSLDVHPSAHRWVQDGSRSLLVTEGIRKGDSAVSARQACIAILGVWNWRGTDESGNLMVLADWDEVPLKARPVYVVFDSDVMLKLSVQLALERLTRFLDRRGANTKVIYLPPGSDGEKQGLDDWLAVPGNLPARLYEMAEDEVRGLPSVATSGRQLRDMKGDAKAALEAANEPPQVYRFGQTLARVRVDETGRPIIEPLDVPMLTNRLNEVADFHAYNQDGKQRHVLPSDKLVKAVLADGDWDLPVLEGVVETPTIRPDGTMTSTPGYDAQTRLCFVPAEDFEVAEIPDAPSTRWINGARKALLEVFEDFPFVDDASRTNALGLLLTPILRPAIDGPVPLAMVGAPQAGSGKTLISEAVSVVATGHSAELLAPTDNDEEYRKRITAMLMKGPSIVVLDNLMGTFRSPVVASALTSNTWQDRVLGLSKTVSIPQRVTWIATGNNVMLGGDLPRRTYPILLDPQMPRPYRRGPEQFKHPDYLQWVREARPKLLAAIFTFIRSWYSAGSPEAGTPVLGSFESWCRVVGGVLGHAGFDDFLGNLEQVEEMDPTEVQWEAFLTVWHEDLGSKPVSVADVLTRPAILDALPDDVDWDHRVSDQTARRKLGKALGYRKNHRYGASGVYLSQGQDRKRKVSTWRVLVPEPGEG